ncbi:hypothetical protein [Actinomadura rugatobispora]|uniref:ATP/GTP-binding protein n=1 Tax=Actinomadura rugatobispora TaxID=1994 RepID=A0ABW1A1X5_9ACTN|nr:hypothetical protein GCM10010200_062150 [Actinomadura rugatobispora]
MPHHPHPRLKVLAGASLVGALAVPFLTAAHANAAPCGSPGNLVCFPESDGSQSGGGGGTGGGGSGGGGGGIPTLGGDDQGLGVGGGPAAPPAAAPPATIDLAERARVEAPYPVPTAHTAPADKTYVRMRTALWVDGFQTVSTPPISAGDQLVQATATPRSVRWELGETTLDCNGPGRPNSTECGHTYNRSSASAPGGAYRITATITWSVSWTCQGGECDAPGGDLADMSMTSPPTPLVVGEIQTNTRS